MKGHIDTAREKRRLADYLETIHNIHTIHIIHNIHKTPGKRSKRERTKAANINNMLSAGFAGNLRKNNPKRRKMRYNINR